MDTPENQWSPRPATLDDLEEIVSIERQVHTAPWTIENFKQEIDKPYAQVWVMTDDETDAVIGGYIAFRILFEECEIMNVAVALPYRSQGLAKRLVRSAISIASRQGIQKIILDVRKGNLPAIQLYHGLGFEIQQVRKAFYSNGEDAYGMKLELRDPIRDSGVF